jgi:hypothetical protein
MPTLPKKVKRQLGTDEVLQRYFYQLDRELHRRLEREGRMAEVLRLVDGHYETLQIIRVMHGSDGFRIVVR